MDRYIKAIQLPYPEAKPELDAIDAEVKALPRLSLARMALRPHVGAHEGQFRHYARWRAGELAVALKIYRLRDGDFPESLDSLSPDILEAIPKDPFTGKDFIYRRDEASVAVYSVGENGRDDGGFFDSKRRNAGDIVWTIKRRAAGED